MTVIHAEPGENIYNVAVCRGFALPMRRTIRKYTDHVQIFHVEGFDEPDARAGWVLQRDKYVGGPPYFEGDWYYTLYLQDLGGKGDADHAVEGSGALGGCASGASAFDARLFARSSAVAPVNLRGQRLMRNFGVEGQDVHFCGSDQQYAGICVGGVRWIAAELLEYFFK